MKNNALNLTLIILLSSLFSYAQNYTLVWEDNFNGTSLDLNNWSYEVGGNGWGNNELQYYTNGANASVSNGTLKITAKQENFGGRNYTSARLASRHKQDFKYGRIEASIKIPETQGIWPAFWMSPSNREYGVWPTSGEIDVMEALGHEPNKCHFTCHYGAAWNNKGSTGTSYTLPSGNFSDGFHEFAVEWESDEIRWYLDGSLMLTVNPSNADPFLWPFDIEYYIRLNVAVGGNWPGAPDATTVFPQVMEVDYVRVYQDTSAQDDPWYNEGFELGFEDWQNKTFNGATANFNLTTTGVPEGSQAACVDVTGLGPESWNIQLSKDFFSLLEEETYTLTFWAKGDQNGKPVNMAFIDGSTFVPYIQQGFTLTDQWQQYTFAFTAPVTRTNLIFNIDLGQQTGQYCFDEVSLSRSNFFINSGFENDYFSWFTTTENPASASFQIHTANPYSGTKSAEVQVFNTGNQPSDVSIRKEQVHLEAGKLHVLRFFGRADGIRNVAVYFAKGVDQSTITNTSFTLNNTWQQYTYAFVPTETTNNVFMRIDLGFDNAGYYFDDFDLEVVDTFCGVAPFNQSAGFVAPGNMFLTWNADPNAVSYELRGNLVGQSGYITVNIPTNSFLVSGLVNGASYFWQVRADCGSKTSPWSEIDTFAVPACEAPAPISTSALTSTSARLNWTAVANADAYVVSGRPLGSPGIVSLTVFGGTNDFLDVTGLAPQTTYEWTVQARCFGVQSSPIAGLDVFTTLPAAAQKHDMGELVPAFSLNVYPTPAKGKLLIGLGSSDPAGDLKYQIIDAAGRAWMGGTLAQNSVHELDVSKLPTGVYFVILANESGFSRTKKWIKSTAVDN